MRLGSSGNADSGNADRASHASMAAPYRAAPMTSGRKPTPRAASDRRARIKMVVAPGPNTFYAAIPGPGRMTTASDVGSAVR